MGSRIRLSTAPHDRGNHGISGSAVRTDHAVQPRSQHIKGYTHEDDKEIIGGIGVAIFRHSEQMQDGIECNVADDREQNARGERDKKGDPTAAVARMRISSAQRQAEQRRRAVADEKSNGKRHHGERIHDVCRRIAEIPHALPDKDLIYDVIQRADQKRKQARHRKPHEKFADGCLPQKIFSCSINSSMKKGVRSLKDHTPVIKLDLRLFVVSHNIG